MENLSLEKFNPLKADIVALVESVKTTVASSTGVMGYDLMKENKKTLQSKRTETVKYLKSEREGFIAAQKFIITFEKEVVGIIDEVESVLDAEIKKIDDARKREERIILLPGRREKLAEFGVEMSDDALLNMDDKAFVEFYLVNKQSYLDEKQRKLEADAKKIEDDRIAAENAKNRELELAQARIDAAEKATRDAENKAAKEKQDLIDAENAKKAKEKADADKLERSRKYQKFLADNGCNEATQHLFKIVDNGNSVTIYKYLDIFMK